MQPREGGPESQILSFRSSSLKKSKGIQQAIGFFGVIDILSHHQQIVHFAHPIERLRQLGRAILRKFRFHRARKGNLSLEGVDGNSETAKIWVVEDFGLDGCGDVRVIDNLAWTPACCSHAGAEVQDE